MTWKREIRLVAAELTARSEDWCKFLGAQLFDASTQMGEDEYGDYCGECGENIIKCNCLHMKIVIGVVSDYVRDRGERENRRRADPQWRADVVEATAEGLTHSEWLNR